MSHQPIQTSSFVQIPRKPLPEASVYLSPSYTGSDSERAPPDRFSIDDVSINADRGYRDGEQRLPETQQRSKWKSFKLKWATLNHDTWLQELLGLGLNTLCLIALVVLLVVFDGKPTDDWHAGLRLSAMISIIVTIMGASMALPWAPMKQYAGLRLQKMDDCSPGH